MYVYVCLYCTAVCVYRDMHPFALCRQAGIVILHYMVKYEKNIFVPTKKYNKSNAEVIKNFI